ncbi:MAG: FAD-dependent monooxygenase [Bacteroidetes bacterium]|nr:FAD-dependent monooxygenase [Bacteroidota bacterium]
MQITDKHTKVLIVGAGPSGLMMAAQLLRYGIQPLIIDNKQGPTSHSNALGVQARSLEIYRQLGVADQVVANGKQAQGVIFTENGEQMASLSLSNAGVGQTAFPYILMYQQYKNERVLLDYLTQNICTVYWATSLISLTQNAGHTEAIIQNNEGEYTILCDWVVGADGAHSTVRKKLGIPFTGDTYPHYFYLADVKLNAPFLDGNYVQLYLGKNGISGFFPMPEKDEYRIIGDLPAAFENNDNVTLEQVLPYLNKVTGYPLEVVSNIWFTTYKLHHRMADIFRKQNCFLIGDAAHIHSPVGAQGMNTGLQDAYNLAWKLAGVINGNLQGTILNTYADERMPVARELLNTTDRVFNVVMSGNWLIVFFKKRVLPHILHYLGKSDKLKAFGFKRVSQIGISYRDSKINLHLSNGEKIKAGDRIPYLEIYDERRKEETDLHAWCAKPGFTLIVMGRFDEMFLFNIAKWITNRFQGILNFYYLPPSGKNLAVFEAFETDPHREKAIIVRPDMHIGYMNDLVSIAMLDNYLVNLMGVKVHGS